MGVIIRDEKGHFKKGNGKKPAKPAAAKPTTEVVAASPADLPALIAQYAAQLFKQKYGTDIPKNAKIEIVNFGKALTPEQLAQKAAGLENQNRQLKSVLHDLDERHRNMCQMLRDEKGRADANAEEAQRLYGRYQDLKKRSASRLFWFSWAAFVIGQVWLIILTIVMRRYGITF